MSYSGPLQIMQGALYRLDSYGKGAAYTLWQLPTGASVFLQGDDADTFRGELENLTTQRPDDDDDAILSWLWDQHDYGAAATVRVMTVRRVIREDTMIALKPGETDEEAYARAIAGQDALKWDGYDCDYDNDESKAEPFFEFAYLFETQEETQA